MIECVICAIHNIMKKPPSKYEKFRKKIDSPLVDPARHADVVAAALVVSAQWSDHDFHQYSLEDLFCMTVYGITADQFAAAENELAHAHTLRMFQQMMEVEGGKITFNPQNVHVDWDGARGFEVPSKFPETHFQKFGSKLLAKSIELKNINLMCLALPNHAEEGEEAAKKIFSDLLPPMLKNTKDGAEIFDLSSRLFPDVDFKNLSNKRNGGAYWTAHWVLGQLLSGAVEQNKRTLVSKLVKICGQLDPGDFALMITKMVDFEHKTNFSRQLCSLPGVSDTGLAAKLLAQDDAFKFIPADLFVTLANSALGHPLKNHTHGPGNGLNILRKVLDTGRQDLFEGFCQVDFPNKENLMMTVLMISEHSGLHANALRTIGHDRIPQLFNECVQKGNFDEAECLLPHIPSHDVDERVSRAVWYFLDSKMPSVSAHFKNMFLTLATGDRLQSSPSPKGRKM